MGFKLKLLMIFNQKMNFLLENFKKKFVRLKNLRTCVIKIHYFGLSVNFQVFLTEKLSISKIMSLIASIWNNNL